jgi:hypothetical protein
MTMPKYLYNIQTSIEVDAASASEALAIVNGESPWPADGEFDWSDARTTDADGPSRRIVDRDVLLVGVNGSTPDSEDPDSEDDEQWRQM